VYKSSGVVLNEVASKKKQGNPIFVGYPGLPCQLPCFQLQQFRWEFCLYQNDQLRWESEHMDFPGIGSLGGIGFNF